jgi:hypothetical protein
MPEFELVSQAEAQLSSGSGRRAETLREYVGYIQQISEGQAGKLQAAEGESLPTVRRRLGDAARLAGKDLVIKRTGDTIYFWPASGPKRGRGRRGGSVSRS